MTMEMVMITLTPVCKAETTENQSFTPEEKVVNIQVLSCIVRILKCHLGATID